VLLPVLKFNLPAAESLYAELGRAILPELNSFSDALAASNFIEAIAAHVITMPYAQRLREVGVKEHELEMLARDAMNVQRLLINNPRDVQFADALSLYQSAY